MKALGTLLLLILAAAVVTRRSTPDLPTERVQGALVETISQGEEVDLEAHLEEDTWTLIEFTADW